MADGDVGTTDGLVGGDEGPTADEEVVAAVASGGTPGSPVHPDTRRAAATTMKVRLRGTARCYRRTGVWMQKVGERTSGASSARLGGRREGSEGGSRPVAEDAPKRFGNPSTPDVRCMLPEAGLVVVGG